MPAGPIGPGDRSEMEPRPRDIIGAAVLMLILVGLVVLIVGMTAPTMV